MSNFSLSGSTVAFNNKNWQKEVHADEVDAVHREQLKKLNEKYHPVEAEINQEIKGGRTKVLN